MFVLSPEGAGDSAAGLALLLNVNVCAAGLLAAALARRRFAGKAIPAAAEGVRAAAAELEAAIRRFDETLFAEDPRKAVS